MMMKPPFAGRQAALRPISSRLPGILRKLLRRHGFTTVHLVTHWRELAGPNLSHQTLPERLGPDGTLTIRVEGASAVLIQHESQRVMERINLFCGYEAVKRVRLVQAPLPRRENRGMSGSGPPGIPENREIPPQEAQEVDERVSGISDAGLKAALTRLGRRAAAARGETKRGETKNR